MGSTSSADAIASRFPRHLLSQISQFCTSRALATVGYSDRLIHVWENGRMIQSWSGHTANITAMCTMHPGLLVTGAKDKSIRVWACLGGPRPIQLLRGLRESITALVPVDTRVVAAGDWGGNITCWDLRGARIESEFSIGEHEPVNVMCAMTPDSAESPLHWPWLACGTISGEVHVWNAQARTCVATIPLHEGPSSSVTDVVDVGRGRLAACDEEGYVTLVNVEKGTRERQLYVDASRLARAPGACLVAVGGRQTLALIDLDLSSTRVLKDCIRWPSAVFVDTDMAEPTRETYLAIGTREGTLRQFRMCIKDTVFTTTATLEGADIQAQRSKLLHIVSFRRRDLGVDLVMRLLRKQKGIVAGARTAAVMRA